MRMVLVLVTLRSTAEFESVKVDELILVQI